MKGVLAMIVHYDFPKFCIYRVVLKILSLFGGICQLKQMNRMRTHFIFRFSNAWGDELCKKHLWQNSTAVALLNFGTATLHACRAQFISHKNELIG